MGEPVVGRVTFEPPRDSGTYETLRRECGLMASFRAENEVLKERLKARRLTVEVEDPNAGGGLAILTQEEAQKHARRAYACGILGLKLMQHDAQSLDPKSVGEVLLDIWMAEADLNPDRLLARLGLEEPHV